MPLLDGVATEPAAAMTITDTVNGDRTMTDVLENLRWISASTGVPIPGSLKSKTATAYEAWGENLTEEEKNLFPMMTPPPQQQQQQLNGCNITLSTPSAPNPETASYHLHICEDTASTAAAAATTESDQFANFNDLPDLSSAAAIAELISDSNTTIMQITTQPDPPARPAATATATIDAARPAATGVATIDTATAVPPVVHHRVAMVADKISAFKKAYGNTDCTGNPRISPSSQRGAESDHEGPVPENGSSTPLHDEGIHIFCNSEPTVRPVVLKNRLSVWSIGNQEGEQQSAVAKKTITETEDASDDGGGAESDDEAEEEDEEESDSSSSSSDDEEEGAAASEEEEEEEAAQSEMEESVVVEDDSDYDSCASSEPDFSLPNQRPRSKRPQPTLGVISAIVDFPIVASNDNTKLFIKTPKFGKPLEEVRRKPRVCKTGRPMDDFPNVGTKSKNGICVPPSVPLDPEVSTSIKEDACVIKYPRELELTSLRKLTKQLRSEDPEFICTVANSDTGDLLLEESQNIANLKQYVHKKTNFHKKSEPASDLLNYPLVYGAIPKKYETAAMFLLERFSRDFRKMAVNPEIHAVIGTGELECLIHQYWSVETTDLVNWIDDTPRKPLKDMLRYLWKHLNDAIKAKDIELKKEMTMIKSMEFMVTEMEASLADTPPDQAESVRKSIADRKKRIETINRQHAQTVKMVNWSKNLSRCIEQHGDLKDHCIPKLVLYYIKRYYTAAQFIDLAQRHNWNHFMKACNIHHYQSPFTMGVIVKRYKQFVDMMKFRLTQRKDVPMKLITMDNVYSIFSNLMGQSKRSGIAPLYNAMNTLIVSTACGIGLHLVKQGIVGGSDCNRVITASHIAGYFATHHDYANCNLIPGMPALPEQKIKQIRTIIGNIVKMYCTTGTEMKSLKFIPDALEMLRQFFTYLIKRITTGPIMMNQGRIAIGDNAAWFAVLTKAIETHMDEKHCSWKNPDLWPTTSDSDVDAYKRGQRIMTMLEMEERKYRNDSNTDDEIDSGDDDDDFDPRGCATWDVDETDLQTEARMLVQDTQTIIPDYDPSAATKKTAEKRKRRPAADSRVKSTQKNADSAKRRRIEEPAPLRLGTPEHLEVVPDIVPVASDIVTTVQAIDADIQKQSEYNPEGPPMRSIPEETRIKEILASDAIQKKDKDKMAKRLATEKTRRKHQKELSNDTIVQRHIPTNYSFLPERCSRTKCVLCAVKTTQRLLEFKPDVVFACCVYCMYTIDHLAPLEPRQVDAIEERIARRVKMPIAFDIDTGTMMRTFKEELKTKFTTARTYNRYGKIVAKESGDKQPTKRKGSSKSQGGGGGGGGRIITPAYVATTDDSSSDDEAEAPPAVKRKKPQQPAKKKKTKPAMDDAAELQAALDGLNADSV